MKHLQNIEPAALSRNRRGSLLTEGIIACVILGVAIGMLVRGLAAIGRQRQALRFESLAMIELNNIADAVRKENSLSTNVEVSRWFSDRYASATFAIEPLQNSDDVTSDLLDGFRLTIRQPRQIDARSEGQRRNLASEGRSNAMRHRLLQSVRTMSRRRGALFHYYLAYVTLLSSVMVMAGTCLHTILQSEQTDRRVALFLHSLLQSERRLRADTEMATPTVDSESSLTVTLDDGVQIRWVSDRGLLMREELQNGKRFSIDRFVFPAGSRIAMTTRDDGATVVTITEPSVFVKYSAVSGGGLNRNKPIDEALPPTPSAAAVQPTTEIILR